MFLLMDGIILALIFNFQSLILIKSGSTSIYILPTRFAGQLTGKHCLRGIIGTYIVTSPSGIYQWRNHARLFRRG